MAGAARSLPRPLLAAASWAGLCKETNYLRDLFGEEAVGSAPHNVILIRTAVPTVGIEIENGETVPYFPEHNAFRGRKQKDRVVRLVF